MPSFRVEVQQTPWLSHGTDPFPSALGTPKSLEDHPLPPGLRDNGARLKCSPSHRHLLPHPPLAQPWLTHTRGSSRLDMDLVGTGAGAGLLLMAKKGKVLPHITWNLFPSGGSWTHLLWQAELHR